MRIQNVTGTEECRHCEPGRHGPTGLMLVAAKKGADDYGPCPHCEAGERAELIARHGYPRWMDGYWQGRPTPRPASRSTDLPQYENLARINLLMARYAGHAVDPTVGLDFPDASRRMEFVNRELAKVAQHPPADVPSAP